MVDEWEALSLSLNFTIHINLGVPMCAMSMWHWPKTL